jgi:cold shock CspA family protein
MSRNDERVRSLLAAVCPVEAIDAQSLWSTVSAALLQMLEARDLAGFERAFPIVANALRVCDTPGRQAARPLLFGDFTRQAIAAGFDRTRFVEWFGPAHILSATPGRARGRVLYFKDAKGHGRILGTDGRIHFVHYSMIRGDRFFRTLGGGALVEFTPREGSFNGIEGFGAYDVSCLDEDGRILTAR